MYVPTRNVETKKFLIRENLKETITNVNTIYILMTEITEKFGKLLDS